MKDSFENILKEKLGSFESDVPDHLWNSIESGISNEPLDQPSNSSDAGLGHSALSKTGIGFNIPTIGVIAVISAVTAFTLFQFSKTDNAEHTSPAMKTIQPEVQTNTIDVNNETPNEIAVQSIPAVVLNEKESERSSSNQNSTSQFINEINDVKPESSNGIIAESDRSNTNIIKKENKILPSTQQNNSSVSQEGLNLIQTHHNEPKASIMANPISGYAPLSVQFNNKGYGDDVRWDFGDGSVYSSFTNTSHVFEKPGTYQVILISRDKAGKETKDQVSIEVYPPSAFGTIPNIFTPNNDGYNDQFEIIGENISSFQMTVFDRFGVVVFNSSQFGNWWDGKLNSGMPAKEDTYYYKIGASGSDGRKYQFQGAVRLVR
ncbi:MAG TPA: gliding motility-associated C-terminal domain-containing protein [Bacteroidia bacterium]|nr:gliding motility-associated C-terminal domain-containing protein [Bacteroidia bacterium]